VYQLRVEAFVSGRFFGSFLGETRNEQKEMNIEYRTPIKARLTGRAGMKKCFKELESI
jgi:hypothetical protein